MKTKHLTSALLALVLLAEPMGAVGQTYFTKPSAVPVSQTIVLDVLEEGAACDGVTNDAQAIQNTIEKAADRAAAGSLTAVVQFPNGTCLIGDNRLVLQTSGAAAAKKVTLQGEGPGSILAFQINTTTPPDGAGIAIVGLNSEDVTIQRLRITGASGHGYNRGLFFDGGTRITIKDCEIDAGGYGGVLSYGAGIVFTRGTSDSQIVNNYVHDIGVPAGDASYGIVMLSSDNVGGVDVLISENRVISDSGETNKLNFGIIGFDSENLIITDNRTEDMEQDGATAGGYGVAVYDLSGDSTGHIIAHNRVVNTGGTGIYVKDTEDTIVDDNRIERAALTQDGGSLTVGGIGINQGFAIVKNNLITDTALGSIATNKPGGIVVQSRVSPVGRVSITGNSIDGVPGPGIELRSPTINGSISGNNIHNAHYGIRNLGTTTRGLAITGNSITRDTADTSGVPGIDLSGVQDSTITGNTIMEASGQGILALTAAKRLLVSSNTVLNPSQFAAGANGIDMRGDGEHIVIGNVSTSNEGTKKLSYGVRIDSDNCTATSNHLGGSGGALLDLGTGTVTDNNRDVSAL